MIVATLIAYQYELFSNPADPPTQEHVIKLDEAVALIGLFCVGPLAVS
jgi:hypothetical protein